MGAAVANATRSKKKGAMGLMINECVVKRVCEEKSAYLGSLEDHRLKSHKAGALTGKTIPW